MRGVVLLVEHLVADQRPACGLVERHVEPLLLVELERARHDQRRRAGPGLRPAEIRGARPSRPRQATGRADRYQRSR